MNIDETATTFTEPWLEPKPSTLNPKTQTLPKVRLDSGLPRELFLQPKPRLPAVLKGFLAVLCGSSLMVLQEFLRQLQIVEFKVYF